MKATGIVRKIDELGRMVIPKEIRDTLKIAPGDPMEFTVDGDRVIVAKYTEGCVLCSERENVTEFAGKKLCRLCIDAIKANF